MHEAAHLIRGLNKILESGISPEELRLSALEGPDGIYHSHNNWKCPRVREKVLTGTYLTLNQTVQAKKNALFCSGCFEVGFSLHLRDVKAPLASPPIERELNPFWVSDCEKLHSLTKPENMEELAKWGKDYLSARASTARIRAVEGFEAYADLLETELARARGTLRDNVTGSPLERVLLEELAKAALDSQTVLQKLPAIPEVRRMHEVESAYLAELSSSLLRNKSFVAGHFELRPNHLSVIEEVALAIWVPEPGCYQVPFALFAWLQKTGLRRGSPLKFITIDEPMEPALMETFKVLLSEQRDDRPAQEIYETAKALQ